MDWRDVQSLVAPLLSPVHRRRIGLAVSGGGDSMAMLALFAEWTRSDPDAAPTLEAITVDHRLRTDSADDAAFVASECRRLDVPCVVRRWDRTTPLRGNLQAGARRVRREAIWEWAVDRRLDAVALAHTQDDVAETFLMRMARGSGVYGLSAMTPTVTLVGAPETADVTIFRPFLSVSRETLRHAARRLGQSWREDSSNDDPRFQRVRMRRASPALAELGLDRRRLAETARAMARARDALSPAVDALMRDGASSATDGLFGVVRIDRDALRRAPKEIQLRAVAHAIMRASGSETPPRLIATERALDAMLAPTPSPTRTQRTLLGATFVIAATSIEFAREPTRAEPPKLTNIARSTLWDGRFWARPRRAGLLVGAFGLSNPKSAHRALSVAVGGDAAIDPERFEIWRRLSPTARKMIPALFHASDGTLAAAPALTRPHGPEEPQTHQIVPANAVER